MKLFLRLLSVFFVASGLLISAITTAATVRAEGSQQLKQSLAAQMSVAGKFSGAYVYDFDRNLKLFDLRAENRRILASVTKLFTTSTGLVLLGPDKVFTTEARTDAVVDAEGVLAGNLYLVGSGDPTFGSSAFTKPRFDGGRGGQIEQLAELVSQAGITKITGRVYGDEELFDSVRGIPASGGKTSAYIGPLSALSYNAGYAGGVFQSDPPRYAAKRFDQALAAVGISVKGSPSVKQSPALAAPVASVSSPAVTKLARRVNRPSDNFAAEMMLKSLGAFKYGSGSTAAGTRAARAVWKEFGVTPKLSDGSGLGRGNRASAKTVVQLLQQMAKQPTFNDFYLSLAAPGQAGTLRYRMRGTAAAKRCRAKTGTLSNVSTLAGYCKTKSGSLLGFAFLMNSTNPAAARVLQDRMTVAVANY